MVYNRTYIKTIKKERMIIRKLFKFEGSHIVRNCSSDRCKRSVHGHSYLVEVYISANGLDNGQMLMDFGLMKGTIKDFIDSFDHTYTSWNKEPKKFLDFFDENSARHIKMPSSPSAESLSLMFLFVIDKIIENTEFANGEKQPQVMSVRVHETATGYAEAFRGDLAWIDYELTDIDFSAQVMNEWSDPEMFHNLINKIKFKNDAVYQQIQG